MAERRTRRRRMSISRIIIRGGRILKLLGGMVGRGDSETEE